MCHHGVVSRVRVRVRLMPTLVGYITLLSIHTLTHIIIEMCFFLFLYIMTHLRHNKDDGVYTTVHIRMHTVYNRVAYIPLTTQTHSHPS